MMSGISMHHPAGTGLAPVVRVAAVAVALTVCAAAAGATGDGVAVEPVTLIEGDRIMGCGVMARRTAGDKGPRRGEVLLMRRGDATEFVVRVDPGPLLPDAATSARTGPHAPVAARLATASYDSTQLFPPPRMTDGGLMETRAALGSDTGALFMQDLLVSGGTFSIEVAVGAAPQDLSMPGPMPHSVRQAYLMCAGDLFRPEDEAAR